MIAAYLPGASRHSRTEGRKDSIRCHCHRQTMRSDAAVTMTTDGSVTLKDANLQPSQQIYDRQ